MPAADTGWLEPGHADPVADAAADQVAERYGVTTVELLRWVDDGLPMTPGGRFDPFAVCNWLSWGRLDRAPALARRWRSWHRLFAPVAAGEDAPRRLRWRRQHDVFLPHRVRRLQRWLPACLDGPEQRVASDRVDGAVAMNLAGQPCWYVEATMAGPGVDHRRGLAECTRLPQHHLPWDGGEHRALVTEVEALVADFVYGYRRHRRQPDSAYDGSGSCLDCAMLLQRRLAAVGRESVLQGGVIANSTVANPHFWLQVDSSHGWVPVDPSIPAIQRMLGGDWRHWVRVWTGFDDSRRLLLARGPSPVALGPFGAAFSLAVGEALVTDDSGRRQDAWPCIDWVCGICNADFDTIA